MSNITKHLLIALIPLWFCCSCEGEQPARQVSPITQSCNQFNDFIKMATTDDIYALEPEDLIKKYKNLLAIASDHSEKDNNSLSRDITFKGIQEGLLLQASASYGSYSDETPNKLQLRAATFSIKQNCIPTAEKLDALLIQSLGKQTYERYTEAPDSTVRSWGKIDPRSANYSLTSDLVISSSKIELQMTRSPRTAEESDDPTVSDDSEK